MRHSRAIALTRRQREVYDFVRDFIATKGYSPSYEEIGAGVGLQSLATIWKHVKNLERKGLLTCRNGARSIALRKQLPPLAAQQTISGTASSSSITVNGLDASTRYALMEWSEYEELFALAHFRGKPATLVVIKTAAQELAEVPV